ncbi:MAG: hypothetical protein JST40_02245 [Armatimonadetes bacterium]|nr:hypothetical protein [Armatimonadota bacterium]
MPTEFHVLDGSDGKAAALNSALHNIAAKTDADIYVALDDDTVPGADWQDKLSAALCDVPSVGAWGLWMGDDPIMLEYVGVQRIGPWQRSGSTEYRVLERGHHLVGCFLAYRTDVALEAGPQPITDQKYQIWEDAWRGRRVQALGYDLAFVRCESPVVVHYPDPAEYEVRKRIEIEASRKIQDRVLATSGIPDPWIVRLKRRLRGG